jgi:hypothetical protein
MATERRVRTTGKDHGGNITSLCHAGEWWSPRQKADAIRDIEGGNYRYYVEEQSPRTYVQVVTVAGRKHLRTTADRTSRNNLDNLPNC